MHVNSFDDLAELIADRVAMRLAERAPTGQPSGTTPDWLTTRQAAEIFKIGRSTLEQYRTLRIGPPYSKLPNGQVRYRRVDVEAWMRPRKSS